jgi:hypothetical protein
MIPAWAGATVVVLGGGPSLTIEQVERVRGAAKCVAVNNAYQIAPWADMLYAADARWWIEHPDALNFAGLKCAVENGADRFPAVVHVIPAATLPIRLQHYVPPAGNKELIAGRNGVHQALNIAVLAGATKVLLLGCDGRLGTDGKTHYHGGHGKTLSQDFFDGMRKSFSAQENVLLARGVTVLNCSPGSAIDSFPKVGLREELARVAVWRVRQD